MLRLWLEAAGTDQAEWRGQLRHVGSAETRYFRDWVKLADYLQEILSRVAGDDQKAEA